MDLLILELQLLILRYPIGVLVCTEDGSLVYLYIADLILALVIRLCLIHSLLNNDLIVALVV